MYASILVVDTDLLARARVHRTLVAARYRVHIATTIEQAERLIRRERIDLAIVDDLEIAIAIRRERPNVIRVLTTATPSVESAVRSINDAEVQRYLIKPLCEAALREAVRDLLEQRDRRAGTPGARLKLSPRLRQVLDGLLTGASEKEIADHLGISHHTAHQYVKALFRRFNVSSRAELMATVLRR
jgi:DNA-binding NarL/FixJ family response regulator